MPTWGEILAEIQGLAGQQVPAPLDVVRRKYLAHLHSLTRRNTILYCGADDPEGTIGDEDVQALMEVFHGLSGPSLDLIVQSPGGSAEATEAMVQYIRSNFKDVRVFVPLTAMSAATMLACSANVIVMGKHSFLGPIDPQIITRASRESGRFRRRPCWTSSNLRRSSARTPGCWARGCRCSRSMGLPC